jgi:hypothetical protein
MLQVRNVSRVLLHKSVSDPTQSGWRPLHFAIFHGHLDTLPFLMTNCTSIRTAATIAAECVLGKYPDLQLNVLSPLDLARLCQNDHILQLLG